MSKSYLYIVHTNVHNTYAKCSVRLWWTHLYYFPHVIIKRTTATNKELIIIIYRTFICDIVFVVFFKSDYQVASTLTYSSATT